MFARVKRQDKALADQKAKLEEAIQMVKENQESERRVSFRLHSINQDLEENQGPVPL
jgi:hypothetical protein